MKTNVSDYQFLLSDPAKLTQNGCETNSFKSTGGCSSIFNDNINGRGFGIPLASTTTTTSTELPASITNSASNDSFQSINTRRHRGEKRPIPDDQKDDKYFERRKRNNEAAKKSRDARKFREDRVIDKRNSNLFFHSNHSSRNYTKLIVMVFNPSCRLHSVQQFWSRRMPYFGPKQWLYGKK